MLVRREDRNGKEHGNYALSFGYMRATVGIQPSIPFYCSKKGLGLKPPKPSALNPRRFVLREVRAYVSF